MKIVISWMARQSYRAITRFGLPPALFNASFEIIWRTAYGAGLLMSVSNSGFPQSPSGTGVQTLPSPIHASRGIAVVFLVCI
jgi:hypothetical protein